MANTFSIDLENGSQQYATGGDYGDMGDNFTIACWVKIESTPSALYYVASKWNQSNQAVASWRFYVDSTRHITMASYDASGNLEDATSTGTISVGTYAHIAFTYDSAASPTANLYINGSNSNGTNSLSGTMRDTATNFVVGSEVSNSDSPRFYDGLINDLRMWSRTLTSTEIGNLYTDGCSFNNGASFTGWWFIDNTYNDSSGNGRTLTPSNSPTFSTDVAYSCAAAATGRDGRFLSLCGVGQ